MASSSFTVGTLAGRNGTTVFEAQVDWSSSSNGPAANSSTVTAELWIRKRDGATTSGHYSWSLNVDGQSDGSTEYLQVKDWVKVCTVTNYSVGHDGAGNGKCAISASVTTPTGTSLGGRSVENSATVTLDMIPRYGGITSAQNFNDEENPVIEYSNPAGSSAVYLKTCFQIDGYISVYRDLPKNSTSYTWVFTQDELNLIYAACADKSSTSCTFFVGCGFGGDPQWTSLKKTVTIVNASPTLNPTAEDTNPNSTPWTGDPNTIVDGISTATVHAHATARKGATIRSVAVENGSQRIETADGSFMYADSGTFRFIAVDSRGKTAVKTINKKFIDYIPLTCDLESTATMIDETTATIHIKVTGNVFTGSFGAKNNILNVWYRYKKSDGAYTGWYKMAPTWDTSNNRYEATADLPSINYLDSYTVQASAADAWHGDLRSEEKPVMAQPVFDWDGRSFAFHVPVDFEKGSTGLFADCVIAQGQTGIWNWRKWASGVGECWGSVTDVLTTDYHWGNVITSNNSYIPPQTFPFDFLEIPAMMVGYDNQGSDFWIATKTPSATRKATGGYQAVRGTAFSPTVKLNIHAIGRWK